MTCSLKYGKIIYDPETGRFISQDLTEYADPEAINGLNLYAYCGNNPVMNVDPTGRIGLTFILVSMLIGAIIGGVSAGVKASDDGLDAKGIALAVLGGVILGAAVSGSFALGGGAVSGLTLLGKTVSGFALFATATIGTALASSAEYCLTELAYGKTPNLEGTLMSGVKGAFQGMFSFGFGALAGLNGNFKYADKSLFNDTGYLFKLPKESIIRYIGYSFPSTIIRGLFDKIFHKNWGI